MWTLRTVLIEIFRIFSGFISFILGLRLIFHFFNVNPATPLVYWVNSLSIVMMTPLRDIVPDISIGGNPIDMVAILSMGFYMILFYAIIVLIDSSIRAIETHMPHVEEEGSHVGVHGHVHSQ